METKQIVIYLHPEIYTWIAECPSLPNCVSRGSTREEALQAVHQTIAKLSHALEKGKSLVHSPRFVTVQVDMRPS